MSATGDQDGLRVLQSATATLIAIWRAVLEDDSIDADTYLLREDIASVAFVQVRSRIRVDLGRSVELMDLVDAPSPGLQAELVVGAPLWDPDVLDS